MNLDEQYGQREGRPDHPDFVRLVEIINEQDDHATANLTDSAKYAAHLAHFADPESVTYMAMQRALRASYMGGSMAGAMMTLWLDAFMAGYQYAAAKPTEEGADG